MKKYICDCCKKDIFGKKGYYVEPIEYIRYPDFKEMPDGNSFDLCPDCFNKIFEPVLSKRKQNEESENNA